MENKRYDAIFIGNSLVAFSAAALLAKKGGSVLLLDPALPSDTDAPLDFSEGPLLYFGYEHGGAVEGFFSKLAYPIPSLKQKGLIYQKVTPQLQIIQSAHRSNFYADEASHFDELKREFGDQTQKLKNLFNQVERDSALYYPFLGQFQQLEIGGMGERLSEWRKHLDFSQAVRMQQKTSAADYLNQYAFSPELREYFNLLSLFSAKKTLAQFSSLDLILLLSSLRKGGVRISGGYQTIVTFFQNLIKGFGGSIQSGENIAKLEKQGNRVSAMTLCGGKTIYGNQYIFCRSSETHTFHFYFTIRNDLLPCPMKETLLLTWSGKCPPYLEDILVLRLNLDEAGTVENTNIRKITASVFLKKQFTALGEDRKNLEIRILERLNTLIPFSESKIKALSKPKLKKTKVKAKKNHLPVDDHIFSQLNKGREINGKKRELLKGAAAYYQDKENKNLIILESDQGNTLGWGSDFIVGARLAELIDGS